MAFLRTRPRAESSQTEQPRRRQPPQAPREALSRPGPPPRAVWRLCAPSYRPRAARLGRGAHLSPPVAMPVAEIHTHGRLVRAARGCDARRGRPAVTRDCAVRLASPGCLLGERARSPCSPCLTAPTGSPPCARARRPSRAHSGGGGGSGTRRRPAAPRPSRSAAPFAAGGRIRAFRVWCVSALSARAAHAASHHQPAIGQPATHRTAAPGRSAAAVPVRRPPPTSEAIPRERRNA